MTEPTDKELEAFAIEEEFLLFCDVDEFTQIARAVLAKWGTLRAEKIVIPTDTMEQEFQKHYRRGYEAGKKATTQQPTQAQVVNQANRPFIVRLAEDFAEECVTAGYVTTKAASYGRLMDEALSTQAQAGAVPPEAEPIVLNCEAPGDLKPGDYVFASRWSDCDPGDPWEVGFVSEVGVYPESMTKAGYVVLQGGSRRWGRAMRITPEQGLRICEQFPSMERLPQDYDAIARVFGIKGGQHVGNVD